METKTDGDNILETAQAEYDEAKAALEAHPAWTGPVVADPGEELTAVQWFVRGSSVRWVVRYNPEYDEEYNILHDAADELANAITWEYHSRMK